MATFSMTNTVKSINAGDNALGRLKEALYPVRDNQSTTPDKERSVELVTVLSELYLGDKAKCAAFNMKVGRMAHKEAEELELAKGDYSVPAIKLHDDGCFYMEMVATRKSVKDPFMEAAKAFKKAPTHANADTLRALMIDMIK